MAKRRKLMNTLGRTIHVSSKVFWMKKIREIVSRFYIPAIALAVVGTGVSSYSVHYEEGKKTQEETVAQAKQTKPWSPSSSGIPLTL